MTKDELQAEVVRLERRAHAERMLKIAAPTHTHNNPYTGSADQLAQRTKELDEAKEREEAQRFYQAYLAHQHARAYADAGQHDHGTIEEMERQYPVLADLRNAK